MIHLKKILQKKVNILGKNILKAPRVLKNPSLLHLKRSLYKRRKRKSNYNQNHQIKIRETKLKIERMFRYNQKDYDKHIINFPLSRTQLKIFLQKVLQLKLISIQNKRHLKVFKVVKVEYKQLNQNIDKLKHQFS